MLNYKKTKKLKSLKTLDKKTLKWYNNNAMIKTVAKAGLLIKRGNIVAESVPIGMHW